MNGAGYNLTKWERQAFELAQERGYLTRSGNKHPMLHTLFWRLCKDHGLPFATLRITKAYHHYLYDLVTAKGGGMDYAAGREFSERYVTIWRSLNMRRRVRHTGCNSGLFVLPAEWAHPFAHSATRFLRAIVQPEMRLIATNLEKFVKPAPPWVISSLEIDGQRVEAIEELQVPILRVRSADLPDVLDIAGDPSKDFLAGAVYLDRIERVMRLKIDENPNYFFTDYDFIRGWLPFDIIRPDRPVLWEQLKKTIKAVRLAKPEEWHHFDIYRMDG